MIEPEKPTTTTRKKPKATIQAPGTEKKDWRYWIEDERASTTYLLLCIALIIIPSLIQGIPFIGDIISFVITPISTLSILVFAILGFKKIKYAKPTSTQRTLKIIYLILLIIYAILMTSSFIGLVLL